jgi:hypothetical protein
MQPGGKFGPLHITQVLEFLAELERAFRGEVGLVV